MDFILEETFSNIYHYKKNIILAFQIIVG